MAYEYSHFKIFSKGKTRKMLLKKICALSALIFLTACTAEITLNGDRMQEETEAVIPEEGDAPGDNAETLLVELSEEAVATLEEGGTIAEGFTFRRVFPEDRQFEERHRRWGLHRIYYACPDEALPATRSIAKLQSLHGIGRVEKVPEVRTESAIPFNDPMTNYQWHLFNGGNLGSTFVAGADLNILPAWEKYTAGSRKVIVGVVDTGVQADHPDLAGVVIAAGENGSKSFLSSASSNPYTITGQRHGTHVAGIIAAINNNGIGVCGIAGGKNGSGGVRILDLQAIKTADGDSGDTYSATVWAADHGAVILNNSWTFVYDSESQVPTNTSYFARLAIDYFISNAGVSTSGEQTGPMKGGLVLFSAGNNSWSKAQPAMYDNVLAVGATGPANDCASYTNYGSWVDICAPGGNANAHGASYGQIYSTVNGSGYTAMQGTSMACPMASGVAALLVSYYGRQGFTCDDLREMMVAGANREAVKNHNKALGPLLDAYEAISYRNKTLTPVSDISVSFNKTTANVSWPVAAYGSSECIHYYRVFVGESRSEVQNIDPFNYLSTLRSRLLQTATMEPGERASAAFSSLTRGKEYFCTVIGYTKSHRVTEGNAVISFTVPTNSPPELSCPGLGSISLSHKQKKELEVICTDPDGDKLSLSVVPGSDAVSYTDNGNGRITLRIDGAKAPAGTYTATVSASDSDYTSKFDIPYTILANRIPAVSQSLPDRIIICGETLALDLAGLFSDEDGDELGFNWSYGSPILEGVLSEDGILSLTGKERGATLITLKADDGFGGKAETSFRVRIEAPGDKGVSIYPEEVTDLLYISTATAGATPLSISDYRGKTIFAKTVEQDPFRPYYVDMRKCTPGIYTVRVGAGADATERKVLKK